MMEFSFSLSRLYNVYRVSKVGISSGGRSKVLIESIYKPVNTLMSVQLSRKIERKNEMKAIARTWRFSEIVPSDVIRACFLVPSLSPASYFSFRACYTSRPAVEVAV